MTPVRVFRPSTAPLAPEQRTRAQEPHPFDSVACTAGIHETCTDTRCECSCHHEDAA